jgi:hypothetical protein
MVAVLILLGFCDEFCFVILGLDIYVASVDLALSNNKLSGQIPVQLYALFNLSKF